MLRDQLTDRQRRSTLPLNLPKPIELYFASENAHDAEGVAVCFAPDALVRSESGTRKGLDAIKAWRLDNAKKFQHRVDPIYLMERDGKTVIACRLSGNFPDGAVTVNFVFKLQGDKIASLEIE